MNTANTFTEPVIELDYIEWDGTHATPVTRPVIAETPWVLYLDGQELMTMMCSPTRLHCLALGFLKSEGLIETLDDVWQIKVFLDEHRVYVLFPEAGIDEERRMATCEEAGGSIVVQLRRHARAMPTRRVLTSGCGGGVTFDDLSGERPPLQSNVRVQASKIVGLMRELNYQARLYRQSRGVHTSALSDGEQLLVLAEDVGRHNTLDKIRGEVLLAGLDTTDRVLLTSGRISSEMITKARKMEVPIIVSRTSPTATSVRLAQSWNMTLIGYVRAPQLRVYTGAERVVFE
ncbi:MAG: formate dehydrogenase accessory sulfurtransferase FdhD [Chloroflexota bacterium]|nr:formate dehydrogenase accessory sulfurtransferase FdhD [Chloroflexota bacterium]